MTFNNLTQDTRIRLRSTWAEFYPGLTFIEFLYFHAGAILEQWREAHAT